MSASFKKIKTARNETIAKNFYFCAIKFKHTLCFDKKKTFLNREKKAKQNKKNKNTSLRDKAYTNTLLVNRLKKQKKNEQTFTCFVCRSYLLRFAKKKKIKGKITKNNCVTTTCQRNARKNTHLHMQCERKANTHPIHLLMMTEIIT